MTAIAALCRITAAVLRAIADELDGREKPERQRRDYTGTTDLTTSLSSRATSRRPGRRFQPDKTIPGHPAGGAGFRSAAAIREAGETAREVREDEKR